MTDEFNQPTWFSGDDPRHQLADLAARRDQLVRALRETDDPEERPELTFQLRAVSDQIESLTATLAGERDGHDWPGAVTADLPHQGWGHDGSGLEQSELEGARWPTIEEPSNDHQDLAWPAAYEPAETAPVTDDAGIDSQTIEQAAGGDPMASYDDLAWPAQQASAGYDNLNGPTAAESGEGATVGDDIDLNWPAPESSSVSHGETTWDGSDFENFENFEDFEQPGANDGEPERSAVDSHQQLYTDWDRDGRDDRDDRDNQDGWNGRNDWDGSADSGVAVEHPPNDQHPDPQPNEDHLIGGRRPLDPALFENTSFENTSFENTSFETMQSPPIDAGQSPPDDQPFHPAADDLRYSMDQAAGRQRAPSPRPQHRRERLSGQADEGGRLRDDSEVAPTQLAATASNPASAGGFNRPSGPVLAVVGISLALLAGLLWLGDSGRSNDSATESIDPAAPQAASVGGDAEATVSNVRAVLQGLGLQGLDVELRDGVIHIEGSVPTQADYEAVSNAIRMVAETYPIDVSALTVVESGAVEVPDVPSEQSIGRAQSLQSELSRLLASTPLIFGTGQSALTELHQRILNNAVIALMAYPEFRVTIAGFTDDLGDDATNRGLSLTRAENVRDYLVSQGLPTESFDVEARGEEAATGSAALAGLERRVEFEVIGTGVTGDGQGTIRVAIVAPSASNDLAFTQSMVDAVNLIASEQTIELSVTDNTFVPDDAAAAVRGYADQGFDLVIAHGSQFGSAILEIAPQYPNTAFAWGTASDTFGLPNVYAYDAAAQEGGYVLGALAGLLSTNDVVGVVGPIEVGDAAQYVNGFQAGARAESPATDVRVTYTGSFSDIGLASEAAKAQLDGGADVMTGSAQMVVGAIAAAEQRGALWFGTQADQASLAPGIVVASQVYHWEVALKPIISDIQAGALSGTTYTANLANGGLVVEYNPSYALSPELRQRADQLAAAIAAGSITPPK